MNAVALVGGAERYEAGSLNVAALIGLDAAVKLLWSVGIDRIKARVDTLTTRLCEALTSSGYVVVGATPDCGGHKKRPPSRWHNGYDWEVKHG